MRIKKNKAFFLDRDGTINRNVKYLKDFKNFKWNKNVILALKYIFNKNYKIIIITNQSGIGRGILTEQDLKKIHLSINKELKKHNCKIHDFFFCPYFEKAIIKKYRIKNHFLRKPNPGMILKAVKKWKIDKSKSFMIGDQYTDKIASEKAGIKFILKKYNLLREIKKVI
jgi:D-glycero-D-manno-heptose 1,7-bisphosphate phosphatase